jgi:hypothetical protein
MVLPLGLSYHFAAYSYNSGSEPVYTDGSATETIAPPADLIYGNTDTPITVGSADVPLEMEHLFSRVKLTVSVVGGTATLSNVSASLATNYNGKLQKYDGTLVKDGSASPQALTGGTMPGNNTTNTVTSDYHIVYTAGENPFNVVIHTLSINNGTGDVTSVVAAQPKPIPLGKALAPGKSYELRVKIKRTLWAGSNVYWVSSSGDSGYLTFYPYTDRTYEGYQGVHFKWGSLVGIDPSGASGSPFTNKYIYIPTGGSHPNTWRREQSSNWDAILPYAAGNDDRSGENYFIANNIPDNSAAATGDICRYIGAVGSGPAGYRMPTSDELNLDAVPITAYRIDWAEVPSWKREPAGTHFSELPNTNSAGTTLITEGIKQSSGVFLPAAGFHDTNTNMSWTFHNYWSGSCGSNNAAAYDFNYRDTDMTPKYHTSRQYGINVRCVTDE